MNMPGEHFKARTQRSLIGHATCQRLAKCQSRHPFEIGWPEYTSGRTKHPRQRFTIVMNLDADAIVVHPLHPIGQ